MANYKEVTGEATTWVRANRVMILNPYEANIPKQISFFEEKIVKVDGTILRSDTGYVPIYYSPDKLIELRDPSTNEKTGETIAQSKVYQALYSLYLDAAENRDVAEATRNIPLPPLPPNLNFQSIT